MLVSIKKAVSKKRKTFGELGKISLEYAYFKCL